MVINRSIILRGYWLLSSSPLILIQRVLVPISLLSQRTNSTDRLLSISLHWHILHIQSPLNSIHVVVSQRSDSIVSLLIGIEEAAKSGSHILSKLIHLLPGIVKSIANILSNVLEPLADVLSKLSNLFKEVRGIVSRKLVRDRIGDLAGDR